MGIISVSFTILIVAFLLYLVYVIKYNKKFKEQKEEFDSKFEVLNKQLEDSNNLIDMQKNVILSQRSELATLNVGLNRLKEKNELIVSQKKSSEVKLGIIGENFMPFISAFPYDHKKFRFLANPCDGIFFGETEIVFMEFKTGNAKLSDSQKRIRDIVKSGKVRFETFRVDDKGTHLKIESSMTDTL